MTIRFLILLMALPATVCAVMAGEWPAHSVVKDGSKSPDGRYVILVPDLAYYLADPAHPHEASDYLADIKAHKVLGVIGGSYEPGRINDHTNVIWSPDSSRFVIAGGVRWWLEVLDLVGIEPSGVKHTNLLGPVSDKIDKISKELEDRGACLRFDGDVLRIVCSADDNPKALADRETHRAVFIGSYDLKGGKWIFSQARKISNKQGEALDSWVWLWEPRGNMKAPTPDQKLNAAYQVLRALMPPDRFAHLRQEQRAWLAAAGSGVKEDARVKERIAVLERMLWAL